MIHIYCKEYLFPSIYIDLFICCKPWLIHETQEFYRVYQHGRRIPFRIWGGMFYKICFLSPAVQKTTPRKLGGRKVKDQISGVQWCSGCWGGLGLQRLLFQLGLHPVMLLLTYHPHNHRCVNLLPIPKSDFLPRIIYLQSSRKVSCFPGYGNFAAETFGGRLFCLLFGMIGGSNKTNFDFNNV